MSPFTSVTNIYEITENFATTELLELHSINQNCWVGLDYVYSIDYPFVSLCSPFFSFMAHVVDISSLF